MFTIRAPNRAHNGISAGVRFTAGVGKTDNPAALAYFRRAGYTVELPVGAPAAPPEPEAEAHDVEVGPLPDGSGFFAASIGDQPNENVTVNGIPVDPRDGSRLAILDPEQADVHPEADPFAPGDASLPPSTEATPKPARATRKPAARKTGRK